MLSKIFGYQEFELYMKEHNFSHNSIEAYRKDIDDFFIFIQYKNLDEITQDDILNFIEDFQKVYSNNTINRKIISIRRFLKYFYKKGIISMMPTDGIKSLTPQKKELEVLTVEEIELIRNSFDETPKEFRDKLIFDILSSTGLLISEVLELRCEDLLSSKYKTIKQIKGIKIQNIKLDEELSYRLQFFVEELRNSLKNKNSKVFSSMSRQNFRARLIRISKKIGIKKEVYPHMIRNTVLKTILDTEGSHVVKDRMGISTIQNTNLYTGRNMKQIKEIYMKIGIGEE